MKTKFKLLIILISLLITSCSEEIKLDTIYTVELTYLDGLKETFDVTGPSKGVICSCSTYKGSYEFEMYYLKGSLGMIKNLLYKPAVIRYKIINIKKK